MLPFLAACGEEVRKTPLLTAGASSAPRFHGTITYPMAGGSHSRPAISYPVWMAHRIGLTAARVA